MTQRLPDGVLTLYQAHAADLISIEGFVARSRAQQQASNWSLACYVTLAEILAERQLWALAQNVLSIAEIKYPDNPWLLGHRLNSCIALKEYEKASTYCRRLLAINPEDANAYNTLGRAQNNLGHLDAAEIAFKSALELNPHSADIHNNLGHVQRARGAMDDAIETFETALSLDPDHLKARFNLGACHGVIGNHRAALEQFRHYVRLDTKNALAYLNIAAINHGVGNLADAVAAYHKTLAVDGTNAEAYAGLGTALQEQLKTDEAEAALQKALELEPNNPDRHATLAGFFEDLSRLDEAAEIISAGLALVPKHQALRLEHAKLLLRKQNFEDALVVLRNLEGETISPRLSQDLYHNLGKCLDRLDDCSAAVAAFTKANNFSRENERFRQTDPNRYHTMLDQCHETFSRLHIEDLERSDSDHSPIFLLGFPRSGTTLLDLMLDSHPQVTTLEEKPTLNGIIHELSQTTLGYPKAVPGLNGAQIRRFREQYLEALRDYRDESAEGMIVDKMPLRTAHAGLIWRLFPNAKFIFSLRHPCDVCLSAFMQQFNANDALANFYSLERTAQTYDKMMSLWRVYTRLGLDVHPVRYESIVENRESEIRDVLDFLGLDWHDEVLDHRSSAQTRGRIATNSYQQVTEPIYTRAKFRWQRYRQFLEPCLPYLKSHIEYFGYAL